MILHIDLDCFFVAAARIKNPSLNGKKVAVVGGGSGAIFDESNTQNSLNLQKNPNSQNQSNLKKNQNSQKGVILSASYEARKFGVKSAMPLKTALELCPDLTLVPSDHRFYSELSNSLYKFLYTFTPSIERFSIDEFFLDLKGTKFDESPFEFAKFLQSEVLKRLNLPCSIGICKAKFIAKLATDLAKPFGIRCICDIKNELKSVEISKFAGIGKSTQKTLEKYAIFTIGDALKHKEIFEKLGKNGEKLFARLSGEADDKVEITSKRKSIGFGRTFSPCANRDEIKRKILIMCRHLTHDTLNLGLNPTSYELKIRYRTRAESSKRKTLDRDFSLNLLSEVMAELFENCDIHKDFEIIHISLNLTNFKDGKECENSLFSLNEDKKQHKLDKTINKIWEKFGLDKLKKATEI